MPTVSELVSKRIGSTITDSQTWNIMYNAKQYSSKGDGVTNDSSALSTLINTTINGAQATIIFPRGTYRIGTALTVPSNVTLYLPQGAKFTVDTGITLTINGPINAGLYQIFSGLGTIAGKPLVSQIETAWFGVPTTTTSDASTSLQKAVTFAQQADIPLSMQEKSDIRVDTQIVIEHGRNAAIDQVKNFTLYGNRSTVRPNFNGAALFAKSLCTTANIGTGYDVAAINMYDLTFDNYYGLLNGYASASGILIGRAGYSYSGFIQSIFQNILFTGFTVPCLDIISSRMLLFQNVISRSCGVKIQCVTNGEFCGDVSFEGCQFQGTESNRPIHIRGYAVAGAMSEVRGVSFDDCVIYGPGTYIEASTNSKVGDIWFDSCAWDEGLISGQKAINIYANGTSIISQVFIDNPYIVNFLGQAVFAQSDGTAKIEHFRLQGGHISLIDAPTTEAAIRLLACEHALIHDCTFTSITGQEAIIIDGGSSHISIQGNSLQGTTTTYFITIGTVVDFIVTNNIGTKAINDASGAVNKLVTNNLVTTS